MTKTYAGFAAMMLLIFCTQTDFAQVTIGAGLKPLSGALLDLKQHNAETDNVTANKGLILPRVKLSDKVNLYPMFEANDASYTGANKGMEDSRHTGLLVFNVNNSQTSGIGTDFVPGMYVWNGEKWMPVGLSLSDNNPKPDTDPRPGNMVKGISGRTYKTRTFGAAGEWMIENLAETKYDTKSPDRNKILEEKVNPNNVKNSRYYTYPNSSKTLLYAHPEYGLLYSLVAANNGQVSERFETMQYPNKSRVQGICPNGWLLPSNSDWDKLQAELEGHPDLYSSNKIGINVGVTVKSKKMVEGSNMPTNGQSNDDGLNVHLVGHVRNGVNSLYGYAAGFWTSSVFNDQYAPIRSILHNADKHVKSNYSTTNEMYSLRCMKGE